jgi:hypothetical protein
VGHPSSFDGLLSLEPLPSLALRACVTCQMKMDDPLAAFDCFGLLVYNSIDW